jgi:MFS family permease
VSNRLKLAGALLRHKSFRRIFLAQSISLFGDAISPIAIAFAVIYSLGSASDLGLILASRALAMVVFLLLGGVWADRLPRRLVMVTSNFVSCVSQLLFAGTLLAGHANVWVLMSLQAVNGAAVAFFRPAASGLIQEAVPSGQFQEANTLLSATGSLTAILGPAAAAGLVLFIGAPGAIVVDAITFAASGFLLIGAVVAARVTIPKLGVLSEFRAGYRAVREQSWIFLSIAGFSVLQLVVLAPVAVLGPLISVRSYGGVTLWASVMAAAGIGALVGDVIALYFRPRRPLLASNLIFFGTLPILFVLALHGPALAVGASGFAYGLCMSLPNVYWFTALQDNVPKHLMARVSSFDWMGSMVLRPIGLAVIAPLSLVMGVHNLLIICGGIMACLLSLYVWLPPIRALRSGASAGA